MVEVDRGQASADAGAGADASCGVTSTHTVIKGGEDILELVTRFGAVCLSLLFYRCNVESISEIQMNRIHRVGEQHTTYI